MGPYSMDLRERVAAAIDQGQSQRQVATRFGVSLSFVTRLIHGGGSRHAGSQSSWRGTATCHGLSPNRSTRQADPRAPRCDSPKS
jgi:hypothetical protein